MLPAKGKPKKFQGYDDVYKQIKRLIAQNVVAMDLCLKAYEEEKQVLNVFQMWKTTCKSSQGPCPNKLLNFADWMKDAIVKAKKDGDSINEDNSNIASIELSNPILPYLLEFFLDVFETFINLIITFWIVFLQWVAISLTNHIPPCGPMGAIIESMPLMNKGKIVI